MNQVNSAIQQSSAIPAPAPVAALPPHEQPHLLSAPPTVLIAVANDSTRSEMTSALHHLCCDVVAVADGYHLIEQLAEAILDGHSPRPGLIIADSILRGCTGLSLLAGIRDLDWDTSVILLTGHDDEQARRQAWEHGVTGVFIEPFSLQELCAFANLVLDPDVGKAIRAARHGVTRLSCRVAGN